MKGIVVFSGSAHHALADEICDHLEVPRSHVKISRFSNDCLQAQLPKQSLRLVFCFPHSASN